MHMLALGSSGEKVKQLQRMLRPFQPHLAVDGSFGPRTDRAVRLAQRRLRLYPPDGVAGPHTLVALAQRDRHHAASAVPHTAQPAIAPPGSNTTDRRATGAETAKPPGPLAVAVTGARARAEHAPLPEGEARDPATFHGSRQLRRFIYNHEAQRGVSNHLYWPHGASGVTLGAGYDMRERSAASIEADLTSIGVDPAAARAAAGGAGLRNDEARRFAAGHRATIDLSRAQEEALVDLILPHYEQMVVSAVTIPLHQYEFDALLSYAYNPGGGWHGVTRLVNQRKAHDAMVELSRHVTSGGGSSLAWSLDARRNPDCSCMVSINEKMVACCWCDSPGDQFRSGGVLARR